MASRVALLGLMLLGIVGCGGAPAATPLTGQAILDRFTAGGLDVSNVQKLRPASTIGIPNRSQDWHVFSIPGVETQADLRWHGQVFVCETKQNCDAIYAYFDALGAQVGPHLYQSSDGRVVVQLNSAVRVDVAAKYKAALE